MNIGHPYLLFLGDAPDQLAAKTADGVAQWRRDWCLGQLRLPGCKADLGLPDLTITEAAARDVRTLVIGTTSRGGVFNAEWVPIVLSALEHGMDVASGLHVKVADIPEVAAKAKALGRSIFDVRHPTDTFPIANGQRRPGLRLLTVGTDCSIGKMFAALALEKEMRGRGMNADFRATGQTGILIAGSGVSVDAVVSDFVAGAVETLAPANTPDHWDIVEGQASVLHPSYGGVTLALVHGSQPDAMICVHEPTRPHMRGLPGRKVPSIADTIAAHEAAARITNPDTKGVVGLAINTFSMPSDQALDYIKAMEDAFGLPCCDPIRTGCGSLVDRVQALFPHPHG